MNDLTLSVLLSAAITIFFVGLFSSAHQYHSHCEIERWHIPGIERRCEGG